MRANDYRETLQLFHRVKMYGIRRVAEEFGCKTMALYQRFHQAGLALRVKAQRKPGEMPAWQLRQKLARAKARGIL